LNANYFSTIDCERDLFINHRNIYYNYDGIFGVDSRFSIDNFPHEFNPIAGAVVLSKMNSVNFHSTGSLRSNDNLHVNGAQPPTGSYNWSVGSMFNCCVQFQSRQAQPENPKVASK